MTASVESCSHCGKHGAGFKHCSRCKQASYCGNACQKADWKRHKTTCAPPVPLHDVAAKLNSARAALDWRGILKWEGRMKEFLAHQSDDACWEILAAFSDAHQMGWQATGSEDHARSYAGLVERQIPILGKLQRFQHQGEVMCNLSDMLRFLERNSEAATWYQRARDVGAAHGSFSVESQACIGLGDVAMKEGRREEGLALLRNALVAAELNELDDPGVELDALKSLTFALFSTNLIDEVEPLVLRYREAAKAYSEKKGGAVCFAEFECLPCSARLHEVLYPCTPHLGTLSHDSALASCTAM
jgi:tetratricopeptide (TPR) repeat protein